MIFSMIVYFEINKTTKPAPTKYLAGQMPTKNPASRPRIWKISGMMQPGLG
jgi:hypothetical protein